MFISKYFEIKLDNYKVYHKGEADMEICGLKLSSKNQKVKGSEELFVNNILLINLKTQRWCKKPSKTQESSDCFNIIKAGIYLLDKEYCKRIVKLGSNNKTNALVKSVFLYELLKECIVSDLFIELPEPNTLLKFNILNAFSK
jgi:hypothetical protein